MKASDKSLRRKSKEWQQHRSTVSKGDNVTQMCDEMKTLSRQDKMPIFNGLEFKVEISAFTGLSILPFIFPVKRGSDEIRPCAMGLCNTCFKVRVWLQQLWKVAFNELWRSLKSKTAQQLLLSQWTIS